MPSRAQRLRDRLQRRKRDQKARYDVQLQPDPKNRCTWRLERRKGEFVPVSRIEWKDGETWQEAEVRILYAMADDPGFEIVSRPFDGVEVTLDDGLLELLE